MWTTKTTTVNGLAVPGLGFNIARFNVGGCSWNTIQNGTTALSMVASRNIPKYKQAREAGGLRGCTFPPRGRLCDGRATRGGRVVWRRPRAACRVATLRRPPLVCAPPARAADPRLLARLPQLGPLVGGVGLDRQREPDAGGSSARHRRRDERRLRRGPPPPDVPYAPSALQALKAALARGAHSEAFSNSPM